MKLKKILLFTSIIITAISSSSLLAQFQGYGSITAGYNKNPLYNYESIGDQTKQLYVELKYLKEYPKSLLNFSYVGGLSTFNQLENRNYYEQTLNGSYKFNYENKTAAAFNPGVNDTLEEDTTSTAGDESEEIRNTLLLGVTLNSRFDKEVYNEFDNHGFSFNAVYSYLTNPNFSLVISNLLSIRSYTYINDLSNITNLLTFSIEKTNAQKCSYGVSLGGGFKYYLQTYYDTTKYEQVRSFVTKSQGKGKPGSKVVSDKKILVTPQSNGTYQASVSIFAKKEWTNNSLQANLLYRYNIRSQNRYLTQYVNTSFLSEDIYNDYFSYDGPEGTLKFSQNLFLELKLTLDAQLQYKRYKVAALNLNGEQLGEDRNDFHSYLELTLSRYFNLGSQFGFDLSFNFGVLRNQSNDDYNDFSSYFAGASIGISF